MRVCEKNPYHRYLRICCGSLVRVVTPVYLLISLLRSALAQKQSVDFSSPKCRTLSKPSPSHWRNTCSACSWQVLHSEACVSSVYNGSRSNKRGHWTCRIRGRPKTGFASSSSYSFWYSQVCDSGYIRPIDMKDGRSTSEAYRASEPLNATKIILYSVILYI